MTKRSQALDPLNISPDSNSLFTALQSMQHLSIGRSMFYELIKKGQLHPPLKIGRASRWKRIWLDQCVELLSKEQMRGGGSS